MTNEDKQMILKMFLILNESNSAIWERLCGRTIKADQKVREITPFIYKWTEQMVKWSGFDTEEIKELFKN